MRNRWIQLLLGVVCMGVISSPQYVWALFTEPLTRPPGAPPPQVQIAFPLLIVVQTFLSPPQGWLVERFGPRLLLSAGAILTGASWVLAAAASSLPTLYAHYGPLGALSTGIIYIGVVGHMVRWFPDKRGLATGLVAAGYGFGAVLTTFPIAQAMRATSYRHALLQFGLVFGVVGLAAAQGLRRPDAARLAFDPERNRRRQPESARSFAPREMLRTPIFWLMFLIITMRSTSDLMLISQMGAFTREFGMAASLVFGLPVLPLALSLDRVTNGLTRPFFGWVSDRFGRENTMVLAFTLEGAAMIVWLVTRANPVVFVVMSGIVFFGWGEIFSLFPSTLTDTYGARHATSNYGFLYIAQGVGSVLGGPVAAVLHEATGSWIPVFEVIIAMNFATAILAQFALRPLRGRWRESTNPAAASEVRVS